MKIINLSGDMISDEYGEIYEYFGIKSGYFSPRTVRTALDEAEGDDVTLNINSGGGMLSVGTEIYSVLAAYSGAKEARVQSMSASAATVMMMACGRIVAEPVSLICIHNPSAYSEGDASEHHKTARELENIKEAIINAYMPRVTRVGGTRESISALMNRDEWLYAEKAREYGLVDEIADRTPDEGIIVNAAHSVMIPSAEMTNKFRAAKAAEVADENIVNRARAFIEIYRL